MRSLIFLGFLAFCTGLEAQVAVVNGASFRTEQPVAGGSWVSGFGTFANVGEAQASSPPLPKTLNRVAITVDGVQAPINYVSSTQLDFVIPSQTATGLRTDVVTGPAGAVNGTVRVINATPGLFKIDSAMSAQGQCRCEDVQSPGTG